MYTFIGTKQEAYSLKEKLLKGINENELGILAMKERLDVVEDFLKNS